MTSAGGYYILVNNKLCPPAGGPRSYKDLEDPKYKGLIVLSEPIGPLAGIALGGLRLEGIRRRSPAQGDRQREGVDACRDRGPKQIARGEYGIFIHPTQVGAADIWKLLLSPTRSGSWCPEDGVMLRTGVTSLLKDAPHPNAGPRVHELLRSPSPPSRSTPTTRRTVYPKATSRPRFRSWRTFATAKPFPRQP